MNCSLLIRSCVVITPTGRVLQLQPIERGWRDGGERCTPINMTSESWWLLLLEYRWRFSCCCSCCCCNSCLFYGASIKQEKTNGKQMETKQQQRQQSTFKSESEVQTRLELGSARHAGSDHQANIAHQPQHQRQHQTKNHSNWGLKTTCLTMMATAAAAAAATAAAAGGSGGAGTQRHGLRRHLLRLH